MFVESFCIIVLMSNGTYHLRVNRIHCQFRINSTLEENGEYGLNSAEEMIAELANPAFRYALKLRKLWRQLINGISRLLAINITGENETETNALTILENALDTLLNDFDENAYNAYTKGGYLLGKEGALEAKRRNESSDGDTAKGLRDERCLDAVNVRFNAELDGFTEDNADSVVFKLGEPSSILQAAGVVNKNMKLYGSKVAMKMKKHGLEASELRDLPKAIANPIAVFNNYNKDGNRSILTELHTAQGNFLVTLSVGKGQDIDFNIVSSVFGKGENNIINWLNKPLPPY